ncbi:hypothetical protein SteCoe_16349 [Stentor coeruleus]|uniref:Uncharacterized protein n=1 Tax=Stentor coeruleus TaxID=5963 RepID=A0A1R2C1G0_9CILI|nr:hypothetical protein SteCoe_16349 [Stentor coeruleus]
MKSYQSKIGSPKQSPKILLNSIPLSDILSTLSHHRCFSAKNSPYQNQTSIERLRSVIQCTSRYHSPKFSTTVKLTLKKKLKKKSKPPGNRLHKKKKSNIKSKKNFEKLKEIDQKSCTYAPKIYKNQIFRDVYDNVGNHDRIIDVTEQTKDEIDNSFLVYGKLFVSDDLKRIEGKILEQEIVRPPDNSYLEEKKSPIDIHKDVMKKLSELAISQKKSSHISLSKN